MSRKNTDKGVGSDKALFEGRYPAASPSALWDIFKHFVLLGCVSFGGPAAHLGYFQKLFVERLNWLSLERYGQLVALSQFLPGPGSSQVGFALGLQRAGLLGGLTAFVAFTLPSFGLMYVLATQIFDTASSFMQVVAGLKLLAVVVVADACMTMYRNFCQSRLTAALAIGSMVVLLCFGGILMQLLVLAVAAVIGRFACHSAVLDSVNDQTAAMSGGGALFRGSAWFAFVVFWLALFGLPWISDAVPGVALFGDFYQAGSLVFGGGHVVLPLLQELLADQISTDSFLLGYSAAQAIPGPMFTLATFLGANLSPEANLTGALIATAGIFVPGFLLVYALLPGWQSLSRKPGLAAASRGVNAAVVGLLLSALYQPVFVSAVHDPVHMACVAAGLFGLRLLQLPVLALVVLFVLAGAFGIV